MDVAFILPGGGISGGVRVTVIAANLLLARGFNVRLLCGKPEVGARALYRYVRDKLIYKAHSWLEDFRGEIRYFTQVHECSFGENEIIIGVGMWASKEIGQMTQHRNKKIQYIHGATPWEPELMKLTLGMPLPKIVVATYLRELITTLNGGPVLAVVPNGIDRGEYYPSVSDERKEGVGIIYSSHPAKDPQTILGVIEKIGMRKPGVPIRVFGTEKMPNVKAGLEYKRFPSIREARGIYSSCKVWIVASKSEGFPAPALEAMACGCAVIATDCGGTRDMIVSGENGYLVKVGDEEDIVTKALHLLDHDDVRLRMIAGAEGALNKFTWESCIDRLESSLRSLAVSSEMECRISKSGSV